MSLKDLSTGKTYETKQKILKGKQFESYLILVTKSKLVGKTKADCNFSVGKC